LQGNIAGYNRYGGEYGNRFGGERGRGFEGREREFGRYGRFNDFGFGGPWWGGGWGWDYPWWSDYASMPWWYYGNYGYPTATYYGTDYVSPEVVTPYAGSTPTATPSEGDYYAQALEAFREGNYKSALRLAGHAAVDNPRDPNMHLLLSLSMFAEGNYQGAAVEAHAIAAAGTKVDWPAVMGFYNNNVDAYTTQLRALEAYVVKNPSSAAARFLLGFHYLAEGHKAAAQTEFLQALNAFPQDPITADLLTQAGGHVPDSVERQLKETPGQTAAPNMMH
jgi:tetratricopeptide (TPR) repeat protein